MVFNVAAAATSQCVAQQLREASATVIITNVGMLVGLKNNFEFNFEFPHTLDGFFKNYLSYFKLFKETW